MCNIFANHLLSFSKQYQYFVLSLLFTVSWRWLQQSSENRILDSALATEKILFKCETHEKLQKNVQNGGYATNPHLGAAPARHQQFITIWQSVQWPLIYHSTNDHLCAAVKGTTYVALLMGPFECHCKRDPWMPLQKGVLLDKRS